MIGKKINQLATELAPASTDLTIIGDPISGVSKKITIAQLGAIFSGAVSFYDNFAAFPATGDINVIYCAKDTKKLYLWSGSAYVEVFPSQALLDTYQLRSEKGNANGYASLDSGGKVPISQLPSSIMEYKGTWNAATNTPTLANGTGDTGDVYICNVAGTVNFGAGPITFAVGDYVIYSGSIWQRSSGAVGTVTSVAASITGDAIGITGSPITTSGTLALAFAGTSAQYINGAGNLINFPTSLVTGTGTQNRITKWGFTTGEIVNSSLVDVGGSVYNTLTNPGQFSWQFNGDTGAGLSFGALIKAGTNSSDVSFKIVNASATSDYLYVWGDGRLQVNNIPNATTDTDRFLVSDSGVIKYRTGAELLSDIGGASASGYVPYTGATANVDLGTFDLTADIITAARGSYTSSGGNNTLEVTHSSGSGIALNITKGGNGEGLYINKTSGSGNAATIIGTLSATTFHASNGFGLAARNAANTDFRNLIILNSSNQIEIGNNADISQIKIGTSLQNNALTIAGTGAATFVSSVTAQGIQMNGTGGYGILARADGINSAGNGAYIGFVNIDLNRYFISQLDTNNDINYYYFNGSSWSSSLMKFSNTGAATFSNLAGTGTRMVVADANGLLSTQAIGSGAITGSGTTNYIPKFTGTSAIGNSNLINDASGNLGLGVTPSAWGSGFIAQQIGTRTAIISGTIGQTFIGNNNFNNGTNWLYLQTGGTTLYEQYAGAHIWYNAPSGTAGNAISFTQAMTLNASGNLGIGTTSPGANLEVVSAIRATNNTSTGFNSSQLQLFAHNGSSVAYGGGIFQTNSTFAYQQIGANQTNIYGFASGGMRIATGNAPIIFGTGNADLDFSTERARITSGGTLYLGATSGPSGATGGLDAGAMYINSNLYIGNTAGTTGYAFRWDGYANALYGIWSNASGADQGGLYLSYAATSWTANSDERLKNINSNIGNAVDKLKTLRAINYSWKSDETQKQNLGLIAQDVEKVFPQVIDKNRNGYLGVRYSELVPVLVAAIQELKAELDTFKNK